MNTTRLIDARASVYKMNTTRLIHAGASVHKNETPGTHVLDSLARREWFTGSRIDHTSELFPPPAS
jgi:hypothetical protein